MIWKCKQCLFSTDKRGHLLKHCRLKHGGFSRQQPIPCLHLDCLFTFKSFNALKVHLSIWHKITKSGHANTPVTEFHCQLCDFKETCQVSEFFTHLREHLKLKQRVQCPFQGCSFETKVYETFNSHKNRVHRITDATRFKTAILSEFQDIEEHIEEVSHDDTENAHVFEKSEDDAHDLESQLELNIAALFLKMQTILHVSDAATQQIIEQLNQIYSLTQPLLQSAVRSVLSQHGSHVDDSLVSNMVKAVSQSNVFNQVTDIGGSLSTTNRRVSYYKKYFPVVDPVEFSLDKDSSFMYVPILKMLQALLSIDDILDKCLHPNTVLSEGYHSFRNGSSFKENTLLNVEEFRIAIGLYIDDFEVANPLGTSRKKHKLCAVYWVLANLDSEYRSSLHSIQLALLCKVKAVQDHGYADVLHPLIRDLAVLEENGIYLEKVAANIRGTVLYVAADNLGAHSLAGFFESFSAEYFCRFCMCTQKEKASKCVSSGLLLPRTKENHDRHVQEVLQDPTKAKNCGVKRGCPLDENLKHFHVLDGFPPDILHDFLEGVVPSELALCIQCFISKKYFTLDTLNMAIKKFAYTFSDKVDRPQLITKTFTTKGTIGGNGHENWALLRLFPLLVGQYIPEGDSAWEVLMLLKDILEMVVSSKYTDELIYFLNCKISEHRKLLQDTFPSYKLRPKHHFIEHYPQMIKKFGPLVNMWTMRFEGKHKFFKKVVHDTCNFKNVALTLAVRHQRMMAYYLASPTFFKPALEIDKGKPVRVTDFPQNVQTCLQECTNLDETVLVASCATIHGVQYKADMIVSVGRYCGLPKFRKITHIVVIKTRIVFVCTLFTSEYVEHLRCYELWQTETDSLAVTQPSELNDVFPLSSYKVQGCVFVTPKRYILC